jgi:hypothetical protein
MHTGNGPDTFRLRTIVRCCLQLSIPAILSTVFCAGAGLDHRNFKTYFPQQSRAVRALPAPEDGIQRDQSTVQSGAGNPKIRTRPRGVNRNRRSSESRRGSFTTQYDYIPVPSGI